MDVKQLMGGKPNFGLVVLMAATAILGIIIAAALIVGWRARHVKKTPYTKDPTAQLAAPPRLSAAV